MVHCSPPIHILPRNAAKAGIKCFRGLYLAEGVESGFANGRLEGVASGYWTSFAKRSSGLISHYSIFDSDAYRNHAAKWLFPQEKATFHAVLTSRCESKMLKVQLPCPPLGSRPRLDRRKPMWYYSFSFANGVQLYEYAISKSPSLINWGFCMFGTLPCSKTSNVFP